MEILKIFLLGVGATLLVMFGLQLFARWKSKRIEGRELRGFGRDVVLYFYSPGCGACVRMNPIIEELASKVKVKKLDLSREEGLSLARELGILGTPTTLVVKNGKVAKVFLGFQKGDKILEEVKR